MSIGAEQFGIEEKCRASILARPNGRELKDQPAETGTKIPEVLVQVSTGEGEPWQAPQTS